MPSFPITVCSQSIRGKNTERRGCKASSPPFPQYDQWTPPFCPWLFPPSSWDLPHCLVTPYSLPALYVAWTPSGPSGSCPVPPSRGAEGHIQLTQGLHSLSLTTSCFFEERRALQCHSHLQVSAYGIPAVFAPSALASEVPEANAGNSRSRLNEGAKILAPYPTYSETWAPSQLVLFGIQILITLCMSSVPFGRVSRDWRHGWNCTIYYTQCFSWAPELWPVL